MLSCRKVQESAVLIALLLWTQTGYAAAPADKCQAAKLKTAGKYAFCQLKAQAKSVKKGLSAPAAEDLAKCDAAFNKKWDDAEANGGTACPTAGDAAGMQALVSNAALAAQYTLQPVRFIDQGNGTILDTRTGLWWEKKDSADGVADLSNPHDADNLYKWSNSDINPDGSVFTVFLGTLNNCSVASVAGPVSGGFAGYCNWRLPTLKELESLLDMTQCSTVFPVDNPPCIDPIFTPTSWTLDVAGPRYWTSLTGSSSTRAMTVGFDFTTDFDIKTSPNWVRAVRDGLQPPAVP